MSIDSIAQAQQMFNLNKTTATTRTMPSNFSDKLQISMVGKDIQTAKNALANAPEIREDLVASIKERYQSGTYDVSGREFADKIVDRYFDTLA